MAGLPYGYHGYRRLWRWLPSRILAVTPTSAKLCNEFNLQHSSALTGPEVSGEDVLGGDEQLLAEVSHFLGAVAQQAEHAAHHVLRVLVH